MLNFIYKIPLSYYIIATAINFLTSAILGIFIYSRNKRVNVNKIFALFCLTVAQWSFFYFLWLCVKEKRLAEFYLRTCMIGVAFMPVVFTHFILYLLNEKINPQLLRLNYIASLIVVGTIYTPLYAYDFKPFLVFPYWGKAGVLFSFHLLHFFANILYSHYRMFRSIRQSDSIVFKKQISFVFVGTIIGYIGGIANYLCWYRIPLPPVPNILVSVYVAAVAYAIVRHHLMDIEVIIKKTLIFAGLFASVFAIVGFVTFILQHLIGKFIPINNWLSMGISIALLILFYDPLKNFLVNTTNKYLFQKKYDPTELIRTFSKSVLTELDLNKIAKSTVDKLAEALKLTNCAILIPNREGDRYIIRESYGIPDKKISYKKDSHLISYLVKVNTVIVNDANKSMPEAIIKDMDQIDASACLAIMLHKQLIGVLCLGKKKSDEGYTVADLDILLLLADALGVAIANALAFEDVRQKEKLAAIGMLAAGIKHDIGTPLNQMSASVQSFLIEKEDGEHQKKSVNEVLSDAYNLLTRCQMTFTKISRISAKFADFAKPKRKSEMEVFNISESIEEALSTLDHEIQARNILVKKDIQENLTPIMADREYMQEIFFNIIRNAAQAIAEAHKSKEESAITIKAKEQSEKRIVVEIKDTGVGIPEEGLQKIFDPYYTTKEGRGGTGLGLAIVRELVERNGGKISVNSELGKGTAFVLEFQGANT